jgi:hypothetical protein
MERSGGLWRDMGNGAHLTRGIVMQRGLYHTLTKLSIPKYQILLSKYPNTVSKYAKYPHIKHNKISPIWDIIFEDRNVIF